MSEPHVAEGRRSRPAPADRLARILRLLRWPVVIVWLIAVVALYPAAHTLSNLANGTAAANLPSSAPSTRVVELEQGPGQPDVDQATVVFVRSTGLTPADLEAVASARAAVARLATHVHGLGAPGQPRRSADGKADEFTANITSPSGGNGEFSADSRAVQDIRHAVGGLARGGLQVAVTGSAGLVTDGGVSSKTLNLLLLTALLIVVIILVLVYRSPLLWLFPLFGALGAIVVAEASVHGLLNAGLTVSTLSAAILRVLVLGAATDYALLLIHRYREELRHHAATADAMAVALRRTLPTLLASAGTVVCAMVCLLAAQSASLHGLGPVGAVSIVAALLAQVTFLPALLLVVGRPAFWPRVPRHGQPGREASRVWTGVGNRVARHPAPVAVAAVVLLGALATGLAALHVNNSPLADIKGHPASVTGANLLTEHYGAGVTEPLTILSPPREASAAVAAARATPDVAAVVPSGTVRGYVSYSATLSVPPYGGSGYATVANLRQRLDAGAPGSLLGGDPAVQYDITKAAQRDTLLLIPLVLAVILVIIALLLRAVVAPLVLVATTALSFAASFGLAALLWRYAFGYDGIQAELPMYIFIFLVALGVDYNIFLAARVREESRSLGIGPGTLRGLGVTGGVITAAGVVMAATFSALTLIPAVAVAELGVVVAVGVLLDTVLVRTILVPASLLILGDRVWWPSPPTAGLGQ
ncbi:MAG TPA: MMPL family transporter [Streptosporangiaceae bacterium]|nr:MMPL family transporter [Streptosporangiaceae bacterium]